ncbi:MAG: LysR family transcriptional regulator [Oceanospirillaceae bacterium]
MRRSTDKYHLLKIFCLVVDHQSFAKAAAYLQKPSSSVSKAVSQLEADLGQSLLYRTTRAMTLTDAGKLYYKKGKHLLQEWEELETEITELNHSPQGILRITCPVVLGQHLFGKIVCEFMVAYPLIEVELILSNKVLDMIEDDIDIAFRTWSTFDDLPLYKIDLMKMSLNLIASPEYLNTRGTPTSIDELHNHQLIVFKSREDQRNHWHFLDKRIILKSAFQSNNSFMLLEAALSGVGIANVYSFFSDAHVESGRLVKILTDYPQATYHVSALYRQPRKTSRKIDCFLDFVETKMHLKNTKSG